MGKVIRRTLLFLLLVPAGELMAQPRDVQCELNNPRCVPPQAYVSTALSAPFNARVRYGGTLKTSGYFTWWLWIKDSATPPCTPQQRKEHGKACDIKVGEVLYMTPPFRTCDPATDKACR